MNQACMIVPTIRPTVNPKAQFVRVYLAYMNIHTDNCLNQLCK
jgi:hypothetical protein